MDFERSRSAPTKSAPRLGVAPPPAHFFDVDEFNFDDFKFDSDDNQCLSGSFAIKDDLTDDKTVCSEPPKPEAVMKKRPQHNNTKVSANYSPKSVTELMDRISEDEDDPKNISSLREGYSVDNRRISDMTDVISNMKNGDSPKRVSSGVTRNTNLVTMGALAEESPERVNSVVTRNPNSVSMGSPEKSKRDNSTDHGESPGITRNPNLVPLGSGESLKRDNITEHIESLNSGVTRNRSMNSRGSAGVNRHRNKPHQPRHPHPRQEKKPPRRNMFQRLFACGAPEVIVDMKQKGVDTVEEVRGSFGDLGLTVKQVFSPVQNTKAGAGMVKEKIATKVKKWKEEDVEVEYEEYSDDEGSDDDLNVTVEDDDVTDDGVDNATDTDDDVVDLDESMCTDDSSFVGTDSGSEYTDDFSEGSHCEEVTSWPRKQRNGYV